MTRTCSIERMSNLKENSALTQANYIFVVQWYGKRSLIEFRWHCTYNMTGQPIPWLETRLRLITLKRDSQGICSQNLERFPPIHQWALLKLASLRYLGWMYIDIIESELRKGHFKEMYYIDLFSGPGISNIEDSSAVCYCSPLIVNDLQKQKNKRFTKMFLNDDDKERAEALQLCLDETATTKYEVTNKDANSCIQEIVPELSEKSHSLIFVDPYSTQFSWNSMKTILELDADIFFLFPTALMPWAVSVAKRPEADITNFFKECKKALEVFHNPAVRDNRSALFDLYKKDVEATRGPKTKMESVKIKGSNYYYDMLFVTKKTQVQRWWSGVTTLKSKIESYSSTDVDKTLKVILKEQSKLTDF